MQRWLVLCVAITFGYSTKPGLETINYPALFDEPPPKLRDGAQNDLDYRYWQKN